MSLLSKIGTKVAEKVADKVLQKHPIAKAMAHAFLEMSPAQKQQTAALARNAVHALSGLA